MSQSYRLKISRDALKLKVSTRIPAQLVGGVGIDITRASGVYTFDLDWTDFNTVSSIVDANEPATYLAMQYGVDGSWSKISITDFRTDLVASLVLSYQPLDATLTALAGLSTAADRLPYFTGVDTVSLATFSAFARTVVDDANQAAMQTTLGLVPGTNVQAFDSDLAALATNATNGLWARTGAGTGSARTLTGTAGEITFTNGDGVSGNPTALLPTALTFTGKTVTGGTFDTITAKGTWAVSGTWTLPAFTLGGTISSNGQSFSGTIANLGTVTTADINGGTIDGAVIGGSATAAGSFTTGTFSSFLDLTEIASPANPAADHTRLFAKDVSGATHLFTRDSAGTEVDLSAGGGGGGASAASQVDMQTATSTSVYTSPGRQQYHPMHPKAVAYVTQSAGIYTLNTSVSSGIASISKSSTGIVDVFLSTTYSGVAAFTCVAFGNGAGVFASEVFTSRAVAAVRIDLRNVSGTNLDANFTVLIFGGV